MTQLGSETKKQQKPIATKISWYNKFSYFAFRWIDNKPRPGILQLLYKADIQMLPGMYIGNIAMTAIIATVATLFVSWFVFSFVLQTSLALIFEIVLPLSALGASLGALPLITLNKITGKKVKIDAVLPFVLAYMATLSSAGMNPVDALRAVGLRDFGPVSREFQKIAYRSTVLGEDIVSSINHVALATPSDALRELLIGMSNIIVSGGSLRTYCEQESKELFLVKRAKLKGIHRQPGRIQRGLHRRNRSFAHYGSNWHHSSWSSWVEGVALSINSRYFHYFRFHICPAHQHHFPGNTGNEILRWRSLI